MGLFEPKYLYIYEGTKSKDYLGARNCVAAGADRLPQGPWLKYRVAVDGNVGYLRDFAGAKSRAKDLLVNKPVGTTIRMEACRHADVDDPEVVGVVRFRKTLKLPVKATPGPVGLDRVEGFIEASFPDARFAGDCVCKTTTGGGHSDHADCAAVDYFDTEEDMVRMRKALLQRPDYFYLKYIILFDKIWFPDGSNEAYSGVYHSHIHVSVTGGVPNSAC